MVRVWLASVTPLYDEKCYREYYERLPLFRRKKADALRSWQGRAQSAGAWSLWEKIRAEYGLPESSVYNLSHSGDYVMCAAETGASSVRVGCDLQQMGELRMKIAERFFSREEWLTILDGDTAEQQRDRFYRYWTLKESFLKATRKGMALPMDSFTVLLGDPPVLVKQPPEFQEQYYYREFRIDGLPYKMAVCTTDNMIESEVHTELKL
ncbi:MAG TPA: 4'-phosphopantetheinyl transferase superfamily protein [Candidatus Mediterraneibacter norfolkensis]|nr:4'-phosphopantetheinyl transferase superfamily protein [Candidatus Mediterraneibacter norfolkensis]